MVDVYLEYVNATQIRVRADPHIIMELSDKFTFYVEGYKWHPKVRAGWWDGRLSLLNKLTGICNSGLAQRIKKYCDSQDYTFDFCDELAYSDISEHELRTFIATLNIPSKFEVREYQFKSILKCLRSNRRTLVSPTSSGKSLMIYIMLMWYLRQGIVDKGLIIVPTISLVNQMNGDFIDYGYTGVTHLSTDGLNKSNDIPAELVITTWQSLETGKTKRQKDWYEQFGVVVGDECHNFKAVSLVSIMSKMESCKYRFGTTGTLPPDTLNTFNIEGLFGPQYKAVTTVQLMDQGYVSKLKIKCIVLKYPEEVRKAIRGKTYQEEIDFIANHEGRLKFIKNLTLSLKGNKLVFFKVIDHGKRLYDALTADNPHNVFYVDGGVSGDRREEIRKAVEEEHNCTLLGSLGTMSTGVNLKRLHHMIAASPSKSKIKVLQSIGRMLRQHETKDEAVLYDIIDDLSVGKRQNYTLTHFIERTKIYDAEGFDYSIYRVGIK